MPVGIRVQAEMGGGKGPDILLPQEVKTGAPQAGIKFRGNRGQTHSGDPLHVNPTDIAAEADAIQEIGQVVVGVARGIQNGE